MSIGTQYLYPVRRPSAWDYAQAWRAHHSAMAQSFLDVGAAAASSFLSAQLSHSNGLAALAAQASIKRAQDTLKAAQQHFSNTKNQINLLT